jgi:hypothetical protein
MKSDSCLVEALRRVSAPQRLAAAHGEPLRMQRVIQSNSPRL